MTAVWVTARPTTDPNEFEDYLSKSLRGAGIVPELSVGDRAGYGLDELASALLLHAPDRKFALVIDNFSDVKADRVAEELLSLVERHRHFHLYVCCLLPHLIESLAAGMMEVNAIEPEEMVLGVDEVMTFAQIMGGPLDRQEAERLQEQAGGCISRVRMMLTRTEEGGSRSTVIEEYLRTKVLPNVGDSVLAQSLMRFSIADSVSWQLFRDLCDDPEPSRLLAALQATGLTESVGVSDGVPFTFPSAVRDLLRDQYMSVAPEAARAFHRRLAGWFVAHKAEMHTSHAFHHAVYGQDWELMDQLWSDSIMAMIQEDTDLLCATLEVLPADVFATRPSMQVFRDVLPVALADTDTVHRRATMRAFGDACARLLRSHWATMSLSELLLVGTGYMIQLRLLGRFQDSAAVGDRVNARAGALAATERATNGRFAWFHMHRGLTYSLLNDAASAIRSYTRAWEHSTGSGVDFVRSYAAANLALTYGLGGESSLAEEWLTRHRELDTRRWPGDHVIGIGGHLAAGFVALDRLDEERVQTELAHLGDGSAPFELWPFIAYLYAQHALHTNNAPAALLHLDQMQTAYDDLAGRGVAAALMTRARADLLIACGRGERAKRLIGSHGANKPLNRVPAARLRVLGNQAEASVDIDPLTWDPGTSTRDRLEMLLLGAVTALRSADSRNAERLTNQALDLYGESGILRPFATITEEARSRLFELAEREMGPEDAAILARQAPVYPDHLVLIDLSEHEQSVLEALAGSGSRQAIADSLFVSINTVKTQLASIYKKMGTTTRAETLAKAREHGVLS